MLTYLRYTVLAVVVAAGVTVAMANRGAVTLALWPEAVTGFVGFGYSVTLPLFVVVAIAAGFGLVVGLIWEWVRERGIRAEALRARRAAASAPPAPSPADRRRAAQDEVLAILEDKTDTAR